MQSYANFMRPRKFYFIECVSYFVIYYLFFISTRNKVNLQNIIGYLTLQTGFIRLS